MLFRGPYGALRRARPSSPSATASGQQRDQKAQQTRRQRPRLNGTKPNGPGLSDNTWVLLEDVTVLTPSKLNAFWCAYDEGNLVEALWQGAVPLALLP